MTGPAEGRGGTPPGEPPFPTSAVASLQTFHAAALATLNNKLYLACIGFDGAT
ncbi:hypothetical protein ACIA8E_41205 [Streptomyces sp. NPDC051664]|uniref:hypothetical protein n=1 Tax=Streptomyces sp. NPDC051664 TaxID=3365668 RepID=UPI0037B68663